MIGRAISIECPRRKGCCTMRNLDGRVGPDPSRTDCPPENIEFFPIADGSLRIGDVNGYKSLPGKPTGDRRPLRLTDAIASNTASHWWRCAGNDPIHGNVVRLRKDRRN